MLAVKRYVSPHFLDNVKRSNFNGFNSNSYPVTYHWKGLIIRKTITLKIGVYDTPGNHGGHLMYTSCMHSNFKSCHFGLD